MRHVLTAGTKFFVRTGSERHWIIKYSYFSATCFCNADMPAYNLDNWGYDGCERDEEPGARIYNNKCKILKYFLLQIYLFRPLF